MPVYIVQVLNNTNHDLKYHNGDSHHIIHVSAGRHSNPEYGPGSIPTSRYHEDKVPLQRDGSEISVTFDGSHHSLSIADDNWKWAIGGRDSPHTRGSVMRRVGQELVDYGRYILRFDEIHHFGRKQCLVTLYYYEDRFKAERGVIDIALIEEARIAAGLIMVAVFDELA